jgi:hypothetical protein
MGGPNNGSETVGGGDAAGAAAGTGGTTGGGIDACRFYGGQVLTSPRLECEPAGSLTCVNGDCLCINASGQFTGQQTKVGPTTNCESNFETFCLHTNQLDWTYQGTSGCTFQGSGDTAAAATGMTGTSGSTGTTGAVSCQWTELVPSFAQATCAPSPTVTCIGSHCICFEPDGGFESAFVDGTPGDCVSNLGLCAGAENPDGG